MHAKKQPGLRPWLSSGRTPSHWVFLILLLALMGSGCEQKKETPAAMETSEVEFTR